MQVNIKEQLIKSVDSIKSKIKTIQNEEDTAHLKFKKVFKPITDPLETLIKANDKIKPILDFSRDDSNTLRRFSSSTDYAQDYTSFEECIKTDSNEDSECYKDALTRNPFKDSDNTLISLNKEDMMEIYDNMNVPFGIRSENKKLMMGNSKVSFSIANKNSNSPKTNIVTIDKRPYELTPGLKELLVRSKPDLNLVTELDKIVYKDMLHNTHAHKRDFHPNGQIKGDKSAKYRLIIKPLFSQNNYVQDEGQIMKTKSGGFLPKLKKYKSNTDYVYWDDPNELIERLKLLIASRNAGNTNHDNEILSIIEELKEADIIKD